MNNSSLKWSNRLVRLLGVKRGVCERQVNDARAEVGIPNWLVERALIDQRARRATMSTALPLPRGRVWTVLGWFRDLRRASAEHAFFSACLAYMRDPRFFDRVTWPVDLLWVMSPVRSRGSREAAAALAGTMLVAASARTAIRRIGGTGSWLPSAALTLALSFVWGKVEAGLASRSVIDGVNEHLAHGARRAKVVELASVV